MVFSFYNESALLVILMKDLQHNELSYSCTTELRNFHGGATLRKFSDRLDLENF